MPVYTTACPRNCYSTCTMRVLVKDGRIHSIEPHPDNLATAEGVCLKGLSYAERVVSPDRIIYPLFKNKSGGSFERISWDNVLEILYDKLTHYRQSYGPQSILFYHGSGTKGLLNEVSMNFWRLFGGCTTTYGDLCWPAGLEATRLTLGENKHSVPWDIGQAKLIILWGKNPAETNIHQMLYIEKALSSGSTLIVIDPRRTESSARANLLLQPRPGTDGALALAVANIIIENDWLDHTFIEKYVHGFSQFRQSIKKMSVEKAAEITGLSAESIKRLAAYLSKIKPLTINAGYGMQRYTNSGQTIRALIALLALTGNIGKPGAGWIYANLQSHIFDRVKDPLAVYPPEKPEKNIRITISTSQLGQHILDTTDPPIKMLWVERGNPVTQNPDTNTLLKAIRSLDFRVVVEQFMTDTAREADLILPAKTMFEQSDVIGAYWHPYIQLKQKIIEPPGEVKPETEIYYRLAQKLDFSQTDIEHNIPGPSDKQINQFLFERLKPYPALSLEKLKKGPILAPGSEDIAFADLKFNTPSGKIEIFSEEAHQRWGVNELPDYSEPQESLYKISKEKYKYSLYFMSPNTKNRIHSQFNNLQLVRQFSEKPLLTMNPIDAQDRNITEGNKVRVFNDRGFIVTETVFDLSIKKGCVAMTNGWWIAEGGTVNFLSAARETDMGYGAAFHDNLVEIEKV